MLLWPFLLLLSSFHGEDHHNRCVAVVTEVVCVLLYYGNLQSFSLPILFLLFPSCCSIYLLMWCILLSNLTNSLFVLVLSCLFYINFFIPTRRRRIFPIDWFIRRERLFVCISIGIIFISIKLYYSRCCISMIIILILFILLSWINNVMLLHHGIKCCCHPPCLTVYPSLYRVRVVSNLHLS